MLRDRELDLFIFVFYGFFGFMFMENLNLFLLPKGNNIKNIAFKDYKLCLNWR